MKTQWVILPTLVAFVACNGNMAVPKPSPFIIQDFYVQRKAKDSIMVKKGIIVSDSIAAFKGLQYYEPDSTYRVMASIGWLEKQKVVFRTNSERSPEYYKFCSLNFSIGNSSYTLIAYAEQKDAGTGLFIPFKDKTNNHETYGGGRYIEVPYRGEKDYFELDFNLAFNPYCHYNHSYSCPLVPFENTLNIAINAGEKKLYE